MRRKKLEKENFIQMYIHLDHQAHPNYGDGSVWDYIKAEKQAKCVWWEKLKKEKGGWE